MPSECFSLKAEYVPRVAAGTVASVALKSRTCSSYSTMSSGAARCGLPSLFHPRGCKAGLSSETNWLRVLLRASETEYGSVTTLVSTRLVERTKTRASSR
jgi:hypothetical protein